MFLVTSLIVWHINSNGLDVVDDDVIVVAVEVEQNRREEARVAREEAKLLLLF